MNIPSHLQYTIDHEWLSVDGEIATVGITSFAADALGDIVFVGVPDVGHTVAAGEACGELESTKSVSDVMAPVDGEVVEVNSAILANPGVVNSDPFGAGWLFRVKTSNFGKQLLDADAYARLINEG